MLLTPARVIPAHCAGVLRRERATPEYSAEYSKMLGLNTPPLRWWLTAIIYVFHRSSPDFPPSTLTFLLEGSGLDAIIAQIIADRLRFWRRKQRANKRGVYFWQRRSGCDSVSQFMVDSGATLSTHRISESSPHDHRKHVLLKIFL